MCMNNEHKIVCGVAGIHFYGLNVLKKNSLSNRQWMGGENFLLPVGIIGRKDSCQSEV